MSLGSPDINETLTYLQKQFADIMDGELVGVYLHGSLAMGGFNPDTSDIDIVAVTDKPIKPETKRRLAKLFLKCSANPYPIEISFLNKGQLKEWQHPCEFDFHYSEFWRDRYENDLKSGTGEWINDDIKTDADLAAHITILNNRGISIAGRPIPEVFPPVPQPDYISSIVTDFKDCIANIGEDPIYCTLNMIRVYWYLKEGVISSKREAGNWGVVHLPVELKETVERVNECYSDKSGDRNFTKDELLIVRDYFSDRVKKLMRNRGLS
ncbi:aminoglycoside adenylyltransferase domain-containing protein [Lysinibacillus sphaericus]